ncbi:hypothetical protein WMY93_020649 [Mugilogobius chulae]|uniref:BRCA1-A complex subunit Abraxas 1 n=1 Tax=Mugilogobius chulae TaxID=88201 RepID=A0AAW0NII1_9GOBI
MAAAGAESTVRMPGIVLSSLMFQHLNSDSDVEGLILGESLFEEQVTINDSQADQIHIEEIYNIQKHIACKKLHSFYTSTGEVELEALKRLLGDCKPESVIGWYKQRRNTDQQMTLREKSIHKNLKNTLSNPHMIFLLLTPSNLTLSESTHKTEYAAYILRCREVINVPVLVNNLGLLEPVSYCKVPALCSAAGYNVTMKKHRSKFFSSSGFINEVEEINSMNDSLQLELYNMCQEVERTERQLEALQTDVSALRRRVVEEKQRLLNDPPDSPPDPKKNLLLHKAVRALFACSPLFQSQTLTTTAFPILDLCCSLQTDEETPADPSDRTSEEPIIRKSVSQKRPTERPLMDSYQKRRKT